MHLSLVHLFQFGNADIVESRESSFNLSGTIVFIARLISNSNIIDIKSMV
ncbi:hypothetical protein PPBDW_I21949 [Photobacterium kishitanii]|nr:hypothetical protein PPBDW_I21949 [Photobacterium kishitanii]